jgi:ribose transport system permease protein
VRRLLRQQEVAVLAALCALVAIFAILRPDSFATLPNLTNLIKDAAVLLILAVGTTFVIVLGRFDLSIGSVLVFSQVASVKVMVGLEGAALPIELIGLAVALLSGMAWGLINGYLVGRLELSAFLATLATLGAALGAARLLAGGATNLTGVPSELTQALSISKFLGLPYLSWIAISVALLGIVVLSQTRFGQRTYAIGSNAEAARRAGIDVRRHVGLIYVGMGLLSGLAGFLSVARFATTTLSGYTQAPLEAITAVALGGASLHGGTGSVIGAVIGLGIPAVLRNGLVIMGTDPYWYEIVVAIALVASIYLDRRRRLAEQRG